MMRKAIIGSAVAVCAFSFGIGTASASTPAVKGCAGASVSANAALLHPYGNFISGQTPRGFYGTLGDAVHALQAGEIPNGVGFDNTCNGS